MRSRCWECSAPRRLGAVSPRCERAEGGIAEDYHIEARYGWWNAKPVADRQFRVARHPRHDVDLVNDLGIEKHRLGKFDLVLKPAKKHRFSYQHLPIKYETDAFPCRASFVFNGQRYNIGLPVTTRWTSRAYRFGYDTTSSTGRGLHRRADRREADQRRRRRCRARSARVRQADGADPDRSASSAAATSAEPGDRRRAGVLPHRRESLEEQLDGDGSYTDFDLHGTYNFNKYVGAQMGWRKTTVFYDVESGRGDLKFSGLYFGGVVRY